MAHHGTRRRGSQDLVRLGPHLPGFGARKSTEAVVTQLDLTIRGGTIVTASDEFRADIGVRNGRIVSIADGLERAAREIDATGLLALPGGIDSHVHISQPSGPDVVMADDFPRQ